MTNSNKNLFRIVEEIAEKEIERNPLEFMKKESQPWRVGNDEFFSLEDNDHFADIVNQDEEDEENEYNDDEVAVEQRFSQYTVRNKFSVTEEGGSLKKKSISAKQQEVEHIMEELEDVFHDAQDFLASEQSFINKKNEKNFSFQNQQQSQALITPTAMILEEVKGEPDDPPTRDVLPYFKDPKVKISFWTLLKDSIGKDITKLSVPVYFNNPTNLL